MTLSGFGVVLRRINTDDIEQIRRWRNQDFVRDQMFERELITETQQEAWFQTVNNANNYYFIMEFDQKAFGLIYAKNVDPELMVGEGGIFIGEDHFLTSDAPARASVLLLYFCFNKLGLNNSLIRVKKSNKLALKYNQILGYSIKSIQGEVILLSMNKEEFERSVIVSRLLKTLNKESVKLSGEPSEFNLNKVNALLRTKG